MTLCPCTSGKEYAQCCQPYHEGAAPADALALMRSRYSAYAKGLVEYIIKTTHPLNTKDVTKSSVLLFCQNTRFEGLTIVKFEPGESVSYVTFHAKLRQEGRDVSFTERSTFEKIEGRWLYLKGKMV